MNQNDELVEYARNKILNTIPPIEFARFYVNWIGWDHVITVLNDAILHGDLYMHITETCQTRDDVDSFIRKTIWKDTYSV